MRVSALVTALDYLLPFIERPQRFGARSFTAHLLYSLRILRVFHSRYTFVGWANAWHGITMRFLV